MRYLCATIAVDRTRQIISSRNHVQRMNGWICDANQSVYYIHFLIFNLDRKTRLKISLVHWREWQGKRGKRERENNLVCLAPMHQCTWTLDMYMNICSEFVCSTWPLFWLNFDMLHVRTRWQSINHIAIVRCPNDSYFVRSTVTCKIARPTFTFWSDHRTVILHLYFRIPFRPNFYCLRSACPLRYSHIRWITITIEHSLMIDYTWFNFNRNVIAFEMRIFAISKWRNTFFFFNNLLFFNAVDDVRR